MPTTLSVLVTGATGKQGGALARLLGALLAMSTPFEPGTDVETQ